MIPSGDGVYRSVLTVSPHIHKRHRHTNPGKECSERTERSSGLFENVGNYEEENHAYYFDGSHPAELVSYNIYLALILKLKTNLTLPVRLLSASVWLEKTKRDS